VREIGIEFISVLGLPPAAFVQLAAQLGCAQIGLGLTPLLPNPHGYPTWSLRETDTRTELTAALKKYAVSISLGEGFLIRPGAAIDAAGGDMDVMRDLGVPRLNVVCIESDAARSLDQCARFAEMAGARGMAATVEFMPGMLIGNLPSALDIVRKVGRSNFGVLVDSMHFFRSGSRVDDLRSAPEELIGYAQLCDVPVVAANPNYGEEARGERLIPGQGELPLRPFADALPAGIPVGIEIPMAAQAAAGVGPLERLGPALAATRTLFASG
jgi:sugar phosphate isomerase/epimerase